MKLDEIEIVLTGDTVDPLTIYIDVDDNSLSRKWLSALNHLIADNYHLEKNYCFHGFVNNSRNGWYLLDQVNKSIAAINQANLGYHIDDYFNMDNCFTNDNVTDISGTHVHGRNVIQDKLNNLHRYFEDLQGVSGRMSQYYLQADNIIKWHIRQLNLLCHEFETWALSYRKEKEAPEWMRPSQLMCWLNAPRFVLDEYDYEFFGIDSIGRPTGGVFVGVNKAVGKHHWEVFLDEGRDSRINELVTSTLRSQTEAAGDFDIEWGKDPSKYEWQKKKITAFKEWLLKNGFDPNDKSLTIGHPQVGQVDLFRSFATEDCKTIWSMLTKRLNVYSIKTSSNCSFYPYHWNDLNYMEQQVKSLWP